MPHSIALPSEPMPCNRVRIVQNPKCFVRGFDLRLADLPQHSPARAFCERPLHTAGYSVEDVAEVERPLSEEEMRRPPVKLASGQLVSPQSIRDLLRVILSIQDGTSLEKLMAGEESNE